MKRSTPISLAAAVLALTTASTPATPQALTLRSLSGRPDTITGNSALLEISGPGLKSVRVTLNNRDATNAFHPGPNGALLGRVEGLMPGKNVVEASLGTQRVSLQLVNHPVTGPVISGPHQTPFACRTQEAGLGGPLDDDCSAETKVVYFYKPGQATPRTAGGQASAGQVRSRLKEFDAAGPRPANIARTTTSEGKTVDYIIRQETGTINRAIYRIAFLHAPGEPLPDPWQRSAGWNGRLVYLFGGGCQAGYHQGLPPSVLDDELLAKGYAIAASSLNVFGNNCNDVLSAETLMMVKEHFTRTYGVPVHTIGSGGSGGSMQQHLIAQNYPGLLDGIVVAQSFPDTATRVAAATDCILLTRYFENASDAWSEEQKTAVSGFGTWKTCVSMGRGGTSRSLEADRCNASVPKAKVYDRLKNPHGARCTLQDNQVNIYGRDEKTGSAPPFVDNTGVQYGLAAFNTGQISAAQFVELNERIGGFDADGNVIPRRSVADPRALRTAYTTGRVNVAAGSLGEIPIIDHRRYADMEGNIHDRLRSLEMRARLQHAHGHANNQVILTNPPRNVVPFMDRWLDRIAADTSGSEPASRAVRNKPEDLVDACWTSDGERIAEPAVNGRSGRCNELYPPHADPRIVAGGPLANDIIKCALKPLQPGDYRRPLASDQIKRLQAVFPDGVCDFARPGVEQQQPTPEPWRRY